MFQGSAPVRISPPGPTDISRWAVKEFGLASSISITLTELPAALATKAHRLSGVNAMLCGSSPTLILAIRLLLTVLMTLTESSLGLTTQTRLSVALIGFGLE